MKEFVRHNHDLAAFLLDISNLECRPMAHSCVSFYQIHRVKRSFTESVHGRWEPFTTVRFLAGYSTPRLSQSGTLPTMANVSFQASSFQPRPAVPGAYPKFILPNSSPNSCHSRRSAISRQHPSATPRADAPQPKPSVQVLTCDVRGMAHNRRAFCHIGCRQAEIRGGPWKTSRHGVMLAVTVLPESLKSAASAPVSAMPLTVTTLFLSVGAELVRPTEPAVNSLSNTVFVLA
jgi:hypothetical protein